MAKRIMSPLNRIVFSWVLRRWKRLADEADQMDSARLKRVQARAWQLRRPIDRLLHRAEYRLTLPMVGSNAMQVPRGSDWSWRPELWRGPIWPHGYAAVKTRTSFGAEATIFHDCATSELAVRQIRNTRDADLAPFGLRLDVFAFDGTFLSLAISLPQDAAAGLTRRHLLRMDISADIETPLKMFARLNIKHGPNTEQIVRELPGEHGGGMVEFDLAYARINEKRVERAWVDLSFDEPAMNRITLRDATFSRRARAEL